MKKHPFLFVSVFAFVGFASPLFLYGQLDPALLSKLSQLSPQQRAALANRLNGSGSQPQLPKNEITSETGVEDRSVDSPESTSFEARDDYLSRLSLLESHILRDLSRLQSEQSAEEGVIDREQIEAIAETQALLNKIKRLQRREIEKRAEEFSTSDEQALKPFGYDLFAGRPSTFAPTNQVPVPPDYVIGPGDFLEVQLFGQENASYSLVINREGIIQFPGVGPVNVFEKGTDFLSLKNLLKEKIREKLGAGVQSSISMGGLRSVRVFLLGDVQRPGAFVVSSLSTMTNALLVGGGIKEIGSLRNIQLKRKGQVVATLDLYDLLLKGDTSNDARIQPGDVIFVPPVGPRVSFGGAVLRPASYELKGGEVLSEIIELAGGLDARGHAEWIRLERLGSEGRPLVRNLNLSESGDFPIAGGDVVSVPMASVRIDNVVSLVGSVERSGDYEWREGIVLRDLLQNPESLNPEADRTYALIRREEADGRITFHHFSPTEVFEGVGTVANFKLNPRDIVIFLDRKDSRKRSELLQPLLRELTLQSSPSKGVKLVVISGLVHFPGTYPLSQGMTISTLLQAAGGLKDAAYASVAELTRMNVTGGELAKVEHMLIKSLNFIEANASQDLKLQPYDSLNVKPIPSWREQEIVEVAGEVLFPGAYPIKSGETIAQVIQRAGGLSKQAYPEGAVFTRASLREKEDQQRQRLIVQLEADIANLALKSASQQDALQAQSVASGLLSRLKSTESLGRLVIDLSGILSGKLDRSIEARGGDRLIVPRIPYEVSVVGEVQFSTSHLHEKKLDMEDYIKRSGGYTANADKSRTFTVQANGAVLTKGGSGWFSGATGGRIKPGDVIVVPIDVKQTQLLENITNATQIIYQLAVAAAAVNSF